MQERWGLDQMEGSGSRELSREGKQVAEGDRHFFPQEGALQADACVPSDLEARVAQRRVGWVGVEEAEEPERLSGVMLCLCVSCLCEGAG